MKTLSINIPTFNRADKLAQCLDSIISQITPEIEKEVEIHIFDNDSTDGTEGVAKQYASRYGFVTYLRRETNIGPDRNFLEILKEDIDAKYYHLMSDDDVYIPNSLAFLIDTLSKNDFSFVYVNVEYFWEKDYSPRDKHKSLCKSHKGHYKIGKRKFVNLVGNELSFLSGMIFRKDEIVTDGMERYCGTNWLQTYCLFSSTKNTINNFAFVGRPIVAKRNQIDGGFDSVRVFGENYYRMMEFGYETCNYSKKQLQGLLKKRWMKLICKLPKMLRLSFDGWA